MRAFIVPALMTLAFVPPALAQTDSPVASPAPAVAAADNVASPAVAVVHDTTPVKISFPGMGETVLNISATERLHVPQDLLLASLNIEKENADPKALQVAINDAMKAAMASAQAVTDVKSSTGQYYVYQHEPVISIPKTTKGTTASSKTWRGTQTIDLKSTNAEALLTLAGKLQEAGLVMTNLTYTLSPEKADEAKDSLMEAALAKVKTRADRAAKAMGKSRTDLVEVSVDAADNMQPIMMRSMAFGGAASKTAPTAEPGETEITLTVTAKALLK